MPVIARSIVLCAMLAGSLSCQAADGDWTVLTMARDGSWGVGFQATQGQAMAEAIGTCRATAGASGDASDCGASLATTRDGWIVANRCGDYKVLATGSTLGEAETEALNREISLQLQFVPDLPPCRRVVTIDAGSSTITSNLRPSAPRQRAARD